eukprot:CAMPEP_0175901526 /NCGR_PEP_ID=MMETSP0108-20121206/2911_1 /TAXON_ID=195067 ORGANISM="Goniomonas pacifica, Strain CCMP1869" /NCGR_SAMPLE_ID=MMETSP0108 /ASSEMBLY_ACC=CAM_ASM_000204 /LENGTH=51 /DNA_ID=CAMNT_0017223119 /DNA_START=609 /DNA_END=764 /DNA_ORIENTATION=+
MKIKNREEQDTGEDYGFSAERAPPTQHGERKERIQYRKPQIGELKQASRGC